MMVKYDQTVHAKHRDERPKTEYFDVNYDPHKALNFVNNNKKPNTQNFDKMTSRPSTNDPLPCYLKVTYLILQLLEYIYKTIS